MFSAGSNPTRAVSENRDGEDLNKAKRLSSVSCTTEAIHHHGSNLKGLLIQWLQRKNDLKCVADRKIYLRAVLVFVFFLLGLSFTDTDNSQDSREREGTFFYSTLPLPLAHEHSDIYVQLWTWDDYHIFLIATLVFTRLLLDEIYHLIELLFDWLMMWYWFKFVCLFIWFKVLLQLYDMEETGGLELAWTFTLAFQANRLTKYASQKERVADSSMEIFYLHDSSKWFDIVNRNK